MFTAHIIVGGVWAPFIEAAMVTAFLICLGIFHCPCQSDHKLLSQPLDSTRIITMWVFTISHILFFQMCQVDCRLFWKWLVTIKFSQGEEDSSLWFGGPSAVLSSGASGHFD